MATSKLSRRPSDSSRFQVPGSGFRVPGSRFRVPGSRFPVPGSGFHVPRSTNLEHRTWNRSISCGRVAFRESLTHLVDVSLKHEQAIGVAVGIGEVVLLALANLDLQVFVQIVHDELLEIAERRREAIVFVVGLVAKALRLATI